MNRFTAWTQCIDSLHRRTVTTRFINSLNQRIAMTQLQRHSERVRVRVRMHVCARVLRVQDVHGE